MRLVNIRRDRDRKSDAPEQTLIQPEDLPAAADGETTPTHAPTEVDEHVEHERPPIKGRRIDWRQVIACGLLPGLALMLGCAGGFLKWKDGSLRDAGAAGAATIRVATDSTIAMLSYKPDTVEKDLSAAQDQLTGEFKNSYGALVRDVVVPGSKEKQISAVATVPAAASVSATGNRSVVLLFVDQTVTMGKDNPVSTSSRVRVTLDKVGNRWLISQFDPV